jgi:hypothetical protein
VRTAASISSTESEIAAVAYQLWLENGCSEVWESEWGGARWIGDLATPGVEVRIDRRQLFEGERVNRPSAP